jgi:hypothetical protein
MRPSPEVDRVQLHEGDGERDDVRRARRVSLTDQALAVAAGLQARGATRGTGAAGGAGRPTRALGVHPDGRRGDARVVVPQQIVRQLGLPLRPAALAGWPAAPAARQRGGRVGQQRGALPAGAAGRVPVVLHCGVVGVVYIMHCRIRQGAPGVPCVNAGLVRAGGDRGKARAGQCERRLVQAEAGGDGGRHLGRRGARDEGGDSLENPVLPQCGGHAELRQHGAVDPRQPQVVRRQAIRAQRA